MRCFMKILWVSPIPLHPITSGNRRHLKKLVDMIQGFYPDSEIDFIQYGWKNEFYLSHDLYKKSFNKFLFVEKPNEISLTKSFSDYWGIDDWVSDELIDIVRELRGNQVYNLVIVEYVWMSRILDLFNEQTVKVIDTHDVFSERDKIFERSGLNKQWFYTSSQQESVAISRADIVLSITKEDADFFQTLANPKKANKILYLGSGVDDKSVAQPILYNNDIDNRELVVGYVASSNALNKKSIDIFFDTLNQMDIKTSKVHFNIAGTISGHIKKYDNLKIYKKGVIDDLYDFYMKSDLMITPMIEGTGLKIKCLEAIEHKKPFMGTKFATNDLPVNSLWHTFASIEDFAVFFGSWLTSTSQGNRSRESTLNYLIMQSNEILNALIEKNNLLKMQFYACLESLLAKNKAEPSKVDSLVDVSDVKVSVIIPVYNTEKYLSRCLDSMLNDKLDSFEIIVVNDGSTDSSSDILKKYSENYSGIVKLYEQKNQGQAVARNHALKFARGEYVYFVDSDDYLGSDSLYLLYNFAKKNNLDICSPDRPYLSNRPIKYISALPGWCCFVKRSILNKQYPIRQPAIRSGQDGVFANMLLTRCKNSGVCTDAKYYYEKRDDSTFNLVSRDVRIIPHLVEQHIDVLKDFYLSSRLYDKELVRYLLFIQDESYMLRFKKNAKLMTDSDCRWLYFIIKSEIINWINELDEKDMHYFSQEFLDISKLKYEDFMRKYINV